MKKNGYGKDARAAAHAVVDLVFDHIESVDDRPVVQWRDFDTLQRLVRLEDDIVEHTPLVDLARLYADGSIQLHHRAYMGHQVCPPLPSAITAELLIAALNQSTAVWEMSPIGTAIEKTLVSWLCRRVGYHDDQAAGTTVSGGSAANLTALLAARARWLHDNPAGGKSPVLLCSRDAHYSIRRAASIMGLGHADVIEIATDDQHRMDVDELAATLAGLEESEQQSVLAIVATSGSTATGAFDRLHEISDLRDRYRTWLHVDAAHGASTLLSPALRHLVAGLERSDSLSWDPHKMMWMPLSLGVILVRDRRWLRSAFASDAPYLFHGDPSQRDLGELTIQCSRRADAVKLWITLKSEGTETIAANLDRVTAVTRHLYDVVSQSDDFAALHEPQFNIFCFRYLPFEENEENSYEIGRINAEIRQRLIESGEAWITATVLKGVRALRVTIINPKTGAGEVERMIESVRRIGRSLVTAAAL